MMTCHFRAQNALFITEFFFRKTVKIIFMCILGSFTVRHFKKIFRTDPELQGCPDFEPKMAHLPQTNIFSQKSLI